MAPTGEMWRFAHRYQLRDRTAVPLDDHGLTILDHVEQLREHACIHEPGAGAWPRVRHMYRHLGIWMRSLRNGQRTASLRRDHITDILAGNHLDATTRRPGVEWAHSVQDAAALVRDFVKWDDQPASLGHFAESAMRAYKIAMTPPMGPVAIVVDEEMQHEPAPADARIPTLNVPTPPAADSGAIAEVAKLLVAAENPVILASRAARTPAGLDLMVELAETLQAGVVDSRRRLNFPTRHPLNGGALARAIGGALSALLR